jgi:hypothetical protein
MIGMQLLDQVFLAVAVLVGAAIVLAVGMVVAAAAHKPGHGPHGGTRHYPAPRPQPDADDAWPPLADDDRPLGAGDREDARELVLL